MPDTLISPRPIRTGVPARRGFSKITAPGEPFRTPRLLRRSPGGRIDAARVDLRLPLSLIICDYQSH